MTADDSWGQSQAAHSRAGSIRFALSPCHPHLYNILQMGTVPALAVAACPSSFANAQNCFGAEGEKGRGHGKQRTDNEGGRAEGRGV